MIKNIFFLGLIIICSSCNKIIEPDAPEKIFEKYKSSVVLIANQYYYEVTIDKSSYFYSPSSEKKIYFTKEDVLKNLSFSTGTGFIISENGEVITNNHVANPKDENYKNELFRLNESVKTDIIENIRRYNDTIENIKTNYNQNSSNMDYYEKEKYETAYNIMRNQKDNLVEKYKIFNNVNFNNSSSKLVIYKLGIAYNDTYVTEFDDMQECVVVKLSDKENVDLALIQTKNKTFNTKPKSIFNFKDNNPNVFENPEKTKERDIKKPVKINEDVFMIGFNRGFSLANTKQGIKSQFTSGKISQENDGERILYTIPTLEGSSGSPVMDKWGNLVGVNFAKMTNSQSFSFAIPVNELKKFYED